MIDFHSHILPELDDGSKSYEMSLDMLRESQLQGVSQIISTSHCYPRGEESVSRFIQRRDKRLSELKKRMRDAGGEFPAIRSGCELNLYCDISQYSNLAQLCIEGTDYLLIEMPYTPWEEWMYDCIYTLSVRGFQPIMAHIDRYLDHSVSELNNLFDVAATFQINAQAILTRKFRKKLFGLFRANHAHLLGSDMHNMNTRRTKMKEAAALLTARFGQEYLDYLSRNGEAVLENLSIDTAAYRQLPKVSRLRLLR